MTASIVLVDNTKYKTRNPVARFLLRRFQGKIERLLTSIRFTSLVEIGCGEGVLLNWLAGDLAGKDVVGVDISAASLDAAKQNAPFAKYRLGNVYELPFSNDSYDVVMCCEVLEHLEDPIRALMEIRRVAREYCLLSVPNEPLWRVLNLARGKYLRGLGNTPDHRNHWSAAAFRRYVSECFHVVAFAKPLPWVMCLCRPRDTTPL